ncbi:BON domain-containing protein [Hassallia byssoidea VB512170]|uniref:BON domain-containing protein n=1 Tax=Hassallia byssoidea VB512170 TaxID=1304833 RepID=A0A846HHT6_9CYAN|nr:BON domain-containing protein [Hassalia byssoidea]NEU76508.1 BON domain-containing protein [Hassalia byssoidea VB512170]
MKKLTPFFISALLLFGAAACQNPAKTSADAPNDTNKPVSQTEAPSVQATEAAKEDAQSETRRRQLNEDIRAREQRNNVTGGDTDRAVGDLKSQVRSKLEANIPNGNLAVEATENGTVTVTGTVTNEAQLAKIEPLSKEIKGVTKVENKATVVKK